MTLFPSLSNCSNTLVVNFTGADAKQLADQLSHSGIHAELAVSAHAAHMAARAKPYETLVMVADLNEADEVRTSHPRAACSS